MSELLGMRMEDALDRLHRHGMEAQVVVSSSPRSERPDGSLRVVRVRPGQITVCAFMDGIPE